MEAKLPLLLRGQEVQQIGPFEQSTKNRSKSKHPLPKGYEWCSVNYDNHQEIASTCIDFYSTTMLSQMGDFTSTISKSVFVWNQGFLK